jgi:hypothetical protein
MSYQLLIYGGACFASAILLLAAMWAGVSKKHWSIRSTVVCGVLGALYPIHAFQPMIWFALAMPPTALVSWMILRRSQSREPDGENRTAPQRPRFQFHLTDFMLLVLIAGVVLAFGFALRRQRPGFDWHFGAIVFCSALIAVLCLLAAVTRGWWRILPVLGLAIAIVVFAELYARKLYHGYTLAIAGYLYRFPEQLRFDAAVFYGSLAGLVLFGLFGFGFWMRRRERRSA